ncbi:MAG: hypothetical protein R6V50_05490 [Thermoplasmatota archaeon]
MLLLLYQSILPFLLSALIVIVITIIAERYGTKVGGIFGTLPSTIIIAFIFIALNQGIDFAVESVAVVPFQMGINLLFLLMFVLLAYRSLFLAFTGSMIIWTFFSSLLYIFSVTNIVISVSIYAFSLICIFLYLEFGKKVPSVGKVTIHYTPTKILFRGVLAGLIIAISVLLSNTSAVLSGIFSIFPAIFASTMIIALKEHGPIFTAGIAKSMIIGSMSVMSYAISIYFLYPLYGIVVGTVFAFCISLSITLALFTLRNKIK